MNIFDIMQLKKFNSGKADISTLADEYRDNEDIVKKAIKKYGLNQFLHASPRLRSDAKFILSLVKQYPKICLFIDEPVRQTYIAKLDGELIPNATKPEPRKSMLVSENVALFGALLIKTNKETANFISNDLAKHFLEYALSGGEAVTRFYGENLHFAPYNKNDKVVVGMLKMRPSIAKELIEKGYDLPAECTPSCNECQEEIERE